MYDLIILFFITFSTVLLLIDFVDKIFFTKKLKNYLFKDYCIMALMILSIFVINQYISTLLKTFLEYTIIFTGFYFIFKKNKKEMLNITIFSQSILFFSSYLIMLLKIIFNINIGYAGVSVIFLLISAILFKSKFIINLSSKIVNFNNVYEQDYKLTVCLLITNIFNHFFIVLLENGNEIMYIIIILNFLNIYLLIKITNDNMNYKRLTREYDLLTEYAKEYETLFERERINTHEFNNQLIMIGMLKTKKEIHNYIKSIYIKPDMSNFNHSELTYISNYTLKWFLHQKLKEAKSKDIKVTLMISRSAKNLKLPPSNTEEFRDLFRLLGIFLDNAIENANYSKEKEIIVELIFENKTLRLIIENTYLNKVVKGKDRGFGLKIAKNIFDNYKIFEFNTSIEKNFYKQNLSVDLEKYL